VPFITLTLDMLAKRGAQVSADGDRWSVRPGPLRGGDVVVEPDLSSAVAFLAAPLVAGGELRIAGWPATSLQAGFASPDVLVAMGADVRREGDALVISGSGSVRGIDVDLADNPELACVLAAVAALGSSPSRIRGIAHMRGHETDRLAALTKELSALGANVEQTEDGLVFEPSDALHGGVFHTYDDHRMAMAAAVFGLVVPGVVVENIATTGKTFPGFASLWQTTVTGGAD
jgi:3-phosphoshikimate 1-carboxyvinyltransferase